MQSMLDQLALPRRLIGIKRLLSPEVGFVHANISNMLNRVGVNIGDAIDKLTSPEVIEGFKELRKIGFGRAGISGMISCPGFNAADAVENLFKIVNYHPFYKEKSTLRLAVKLIGINKDPIPVLNCLHDNFTNPRDVLEAIVVSKKYNGEKLSDYVPESLEEFLAEIAKNPDLLRRFEASDILSNEDERENSDISSGDEGEAEELAMSDKMAPRGKRKGRFGYDEEESDSDILIDRGECADVDVSILAEGETVSGLEFRSGLEEVEEQYNSNPMTEFAIGEAFPLAAEKAQKTSGFLEK